MSKLVSKVTGVVACSLLTSSVALAGGMIMPPAPQARSPWLVRARVLSILPQPSSSTIVPNVGGTVTHISRQTVPEVDVSYFFTRNIAAELVAGTARHSVRTSAGINLGKVSILPPTVTLQWHFMPESKFSPYVGAGVNYTHFFNVDSGPVASSVSYDSSWGGALQIGADYYLNRNWLINIDAKKVWIKTDVTARVPGLAANQTTTAKINPYLVGVGVGYRFG